MIFVVLKINKYIILCEYLSGVPYREYISNIQDIRSSDTEQKKF